MSLTLMSFKKVLIYFWMLWWLIAFLTDFAGAMVQLGLVSGGWLPHSNYPYLVKSLAIYHPPAPLPPFLFAGIICWSFLSTVFFVAAAFTPMSPRQHWLARVNTAYIVSLGLWLAFFIADQIVMKFSLEQNHMVQAGFQLLTFLAIHILPDERTD